MSQPDSVLRTVDDALDEHRKKLECCDFCNRMNPSRRYSPPLGSYREGCDRHQRPAMVATTLSHCKQDEYPMRTSSRAGSKNLQVVSGLKNRNFVSQAMTAKEIQDAINQHTKSANPPAKPSSEPVHLRPGVVVSKPQFSRSKQSETLPDVLSQSATIHIMTQRDISQSRTLDLLPAELSPPMTTRTTTQPSIAQPKQIELQSSRILSADSTPLKFPTISPPKQLQVASGKHSRPPIQSEASFKRAPAFAKGNPKLSKEYIHHAAALAAHILIDSREPIHEPALIILDESPEKTTVQQLEPAPKRAPIPSPKIIWDEQYKGNASALTEHQRPASRKPRHVPGSFDLNKPPKQAPRAAPTVPKLISSSTNDIGDMRRTNVPSMFIVAKKKNDDEQRRNGAEILCLPSLRKLKVKKQDDGGLVC